MGHDEVTVVVDTHALLWWINGSEELSENAQDRIRQSAVSIAAITCWEIAFLAKRRRIAIANAVEWFGEVTRLPDVTVQPLTMEIAAIAAGLCETMRDPADCLIVATALHQRFPLVTKDERIRAAGVVETIW